MTFVSLIFLHTVNCKLIHTDQISWLCKAAKIECGIAKCTIIGQQRDGSDMIYFGLQAHICDILHDCNSNLDFASLFRVNMIFDKYFQTIIIKTMMIL